MRTRFFLLSLAGLALCSGLRAHVVAHATLLSAEEGTGTSAPAAAEEEGKPQSDKLPLGIDAMGRDVRHIGEMVADRVDRIIQKKSFDLLGNPWTFQGIPLIFPSPVGTQLGMKVLLADISRQDPHNVEIDSQVLASDRGMHKHHFRIDFPHAFNERFRLIARVAYDRDFTFPYFGQGNGIKIDSNALSAGSSIYQTTRSSPELTLNVLRRVSKYLRIGPVFGFKWTEVSAPAGSLLLADNPVGIAGGRTHYLGFAIVHSTLDFEPYPSVGSEHEFYAYLYHPAVGADYSFVRTTYTFRHYIPLQRGLVFAHRTLFETFLGDAPFYELDTVGGTNPHVGLGGDKYLRGYAVNEYVDKIRLLLAFELRWDILFFEFYRQNYSLGLVPFVDLGHVWPQSLPVDLDRWHASAGWGARLAWNSRFIIRADLAFSSENILFHADIGHVF